MPAGISGSLVSSYFTEHLLARDFRGRVGEATRAAANRRFAAWWRSDGAALGPASSSRAIWDRACVPLAELLGFHPQLDGSMGSGVTMLAGLWTDDLDALWRAAVRRAVRV